MENNSRKALMDAAMELVAEHGLYNFSMKDVTQRVGVSEALVYKHFKSKDNLLYCCFESVHRAIAAIFDNLNLIGQYRGPEDFYATVRLYWMMYFDYLVKQGSATIFYFSYRDSEFIREVHAHDEEARVSFFQSFAAYFYEMDKVFHIYEKTSKDHLWTYILDTTGIFAKRVIRGELPSTPESYENVWQLIAGGLLGLLQRPNEK